LAGVVSELTDRYHVPLLASGGFSSLTLCNKAADLINDFDGVTHCYYFGDFDPSGVKIDPAIDSRLGERADRDKFTFTRVALTPAQIEQHSLPTRPARKDGDDKNPHLASFEEQHGDDAVELDALPPDALREMVDDVITNHVDPVEVERIKRKEERDRAKLKRALTNLRV
jgi:hypothetical protein